MFTGSKTESSCKIVLIISYSISYWHRNPHGQMKELNVRKHSLLTKVAIISQLSSELEHGLCQQRLCLGVAWSFLLAADF